MNKIKIAYCGYDFFYHCLEDIINNDVYEIVKIFTFETDNIYNFNTHIRRIASENNIEISDKKMSHQDVEKLNQTGCEYIISAAYPYKIPITFFDGFGFNIHPSLLPKYRGPWPLPFIILDGESKSGITIHILEDTMDTGAILLQESFDITPHEDLETISIKSQMLAKRLLKKFLKTPDIFIQNMQPQAGNSIYIPFPRDEDMTIDWSWNVDKIKKFVRAFGKMDSCCILEGKHLVVQDVNIWKEDHTFPVGKIIHKTNKEFLVSANDGFVCLRFFSEDLDYS